MFPLFTRGLFRTLYARNAGCRVLTPEKPCSQVGLGPEQESASPRLPLQRKTRLHRLRAIRSLPFDLFDVGILAPTAPPHAARTRTDGACPPGWAESRRALPTPAVGSGRHNAAARGVSEQ